MDFAETMETENGNGNGNTEMETRKVLRMLTSALVYNGPYLLAHVFFESVSAPLLSGMQLPRFLDQGPVAISRNSQNASASLPLD